MARNLAPKHHFCRRVGEKLCDLDRCPVTRRNYPPGIHGPKGRKQKVTEYGLQLLEKQKARIIYGVLERQFQRYYERARRTVGDSALRLTQLLETRLDNVVYRLGFAKSRAAARQAVGHGHITVNGRRVTIPSYEVHVGDCVAVHASSQSSPLFREYPKLAAANQRVVPAWLVVSPDAFQGRVLRPPALGDVAVPFRMQSIIEFYSR